MANRFVLNETSYHGAGAVREIPAEIKARGFKKIFALLDRRLYSHRDQRHPLYHISQ